MEILQKIDSDDLLKKMQNWNYDGNIKNFANSLNYNEFESILNWMDSLELDSSDIIGDVYSGGLYIIDSNGFKELSKDDILYIKLNNNKYCVVE